MGRGSELEACLKEKPLLAGMQCEGCRGSRGRSVPKVKKGPVSEGLSMFNYLDFIFKERVQSSKAKVIRFVSQWQF